MSETTTQLRPRAEDLTPDEIYTEGHWGFCPDCHRLPNGYVNIGKGHWMVCPECKVYWFVGSNLFSSWRDETEEQQRATYDRMGIADFRRVEDGYYPPEDEADTETEKSNTSAGRPPVPGVIPFPQRVPEDDGLPF